MPESSLEVKNTPSADFLCRMSPLRQFSQASGSLMSVHRNPYTLNAFCTKDNVPECLIYVNQEVCSFGLPPLCLEADRSSQLDVVAALNSLNDLIELHRRGQRSLEHMQVEQMKTSGNVDFLQLSNTRLKDQLELCKRENVALLERERQLQLKVKGLQSCLKNEKEEVQKLQNIIASRASQYNHDMKRREREFSKLKERLNQLLVDKKEKKQAIEVLNYIGRADGKRSLWKTGKTEAKHEGEMYRTLLSDYDSRQKELVLENAELRKVLQQMKGDMVSLLSSGKPAAKGEKSEDVQLQGESEEEEEEEEEEVSTSSKDGTSCVEAREKLTNSIRLKWRKLKCHVERLDSQASFGQMGESADKDAVPRETHEQEMERLKVEIQQCKDFIQTQQQLLQQRLSSPCEEETASLLNNCYMLDEKDRLKEEWDSLEEQRKNFEKERTNFTEAAIRLSHERKTFEEDRATWLKYQFLNLTPFADQKKAQMSKSKSAFSVSEPEASSVSSLEALVKSQSHCPSFAQNDQNCRAASRITPPQKIGFKAQTQPNQTEGIRPGSDQRCLSALSESDIPVKHQPWSS